MKGTGDVSLVLGMQVTRRRENGTLTISQEKHTKPIVGPFGMADCHAAISPGYGSEFSTKQSEGTALNEEETEQ